jgi:hypothetical protein
LDRLCDHKKSLHILVERESIRSLINLLKKGNQKAEVLVSCLKGMSKLTRGMSLIDRVAGVTFHCGRMTYDVVCHSLTNNSFCIC